MSKMHTMTDSAGRDIPIKYVTKFDRDRDALCKKIRTRFEKERARLQKVLTDSLADVEKFRSANNASGGEKGNFQVTSFDGLSMVQLKQGYQVKLDARVATARKMMLDYASKAAGIDEDGHDGSAVAQIIHAAFAANRAGILPYAKILTLIRLKINVPEWQEARQILIESIQPEKGRSYLYCYVKKNHQAKPEIIRLDIADCEWPTDPEATK